MINFFYLLLSCLFFASSHTHTGERILVSNEWMMIVFCLCVCVMKRKRERKRERKRRGAGKISPPSSFLSAGVQCDRLRRILERERERVEILIKSSYV